MGAVYLGEHPLIGKKVAIKVLHDEMAEDREVVARFFTEAKSVNDIHHENIVDVTDFGRTPEGRAYILMELLEGESLAARLNGGPPPLDETLHILRQAAGALAASHAKGIVHRDIKPDNIFLARRSHDRCFVKLLDFGIVKLTGDGAPWKTRTGAVIGSPLYMSPEQCAGHGRVDARSDVYSLGVVMHELLTGRPPFLSSGLGDILRGHIKERPLPPSSAPPPLRAMVMKCLEKDPAARFPSMDELRRALENFRGRSTTLSQSIGELSAIQVPRRRAPLYFVVGGVLSAALAAIVILSRPVEKIPVPAVATPIAIAAPSPPPVVAAPEPPPPEIKRPKPARKPKPATEKPAAPKPPKSETLDDGLL